MRIDIKLKPSAFHIDKKTDKAIKVHSWNFYSKIPKIKKHILEKLTDPSLIAVSYTHLTLPTTPYV